MALIVIAARVECVAELRLGCPGALVLAVLDRPGLAAAALDAGADAVVCAGAPLELWARVRALARRAEMADRQGALTLDHRARTALVDGVAVELRPREFALLACLASAPGRVFTKGELVAACWPNRPPPDSRALDAQIGRLRHKLGRGSASLLTVWSVGYRLDRAR